MYCKPTDHWSICAKNVREAIRHTNDPAVALAVAVEWGERYRRLYEANPQATWTTTDQQRLEAVLEKLWDESIGQFVDPASLAFSLALAKYAKNLSAMLEWMGGAAAVFFYALLAPSPIANDFTEAKPDNEEINKLLFSKFPLSLQGTIQLRYPPYVNQAYQECSGGILP